MNKPYLAALVVACVAVPIILLQRSENSKLKTESKTLQTSLEKAKRSERNAQRSEQRAQSTKSAASLESADAGARAYRPGALKAILAESDPMNRVRELLAYVEGIDPAGIPAALKELREGSPEWDPDAKMLAHLLLTRWTQEDPEGALASLDGVHQRKGGSEAASILAALAAQDPKRAAEWLKDPKNVLIHQPWMGQILAGTVAKEWVRQDPEAALAWAESLPKNQQAGAYSGVLGSIAGTDPVRASTLAMNLEAGEARTHIVGEIAGVWARTSPQEAAAWARSLEGDEQRRAVRQSLDTWAQSEPANAARFLDGLPEEERASQYVTAVAGNWSRQDPPRAADWVADQPDGTGKNDAMGTVMWNWTNQDPEAAGTWLGDQPVGPARDRGITGLAKAAFEFDESSALSWAAEISDEEMRNGSVNIGLHAWRERDPEAAQEWADANGVEMPPAREDGK